MTKKPRPLSAKAPSVEEFLEPFPKEIQFIVNRLRKLIRQAVPEIIERMYPGWKLIGYRAQRGNDSYYFGFLAPFEDRVVLGFEYGKMLSDPHKVLEGTGIQVRQVVIRTQRDIWKKVLLPLILEAVAIATERKKEKNDNKQQ